PLARRRAPVAQLDRALASGAKGYRFDSCRAHHHPFQVHGMSDDEAEVDAARFRPHAAQPMAEMFDDVSGRYDLLNTLLSMGQDRAWRRAMWREVPARARAVLDLCTGSGVSLPGLRRPGRLVIGVDVSLRMLERAAESQ